MDQATLHWSWNQGSNAMSRHPRMVSQTSNQILLLNTETTAAMEFATRVACRVGHGEDSRLIHLQCVFDKCIGLILVTMDLNSQRVSKFQMDDPIGIHRRKPNRNNWCVFSKDEKKTFPVPVLGPE